MRHKIRVISNIAVFVIVLFFGVIPVEAQNLAEFEKRMTEFTLDNGLKFLIFERRDIPVISFDTYADVGSVDEITGQTGIAHLFEHMAFKGTKTIGTKNYKAEARAMAEVDKIYEQILVERRKGDKADSNRLQMLNEEFKTAQKQADKYLVYDQFEETLTRAGGRWLNAFTGRDDTEYVVNLPSNQVELWMSVESDRFMNPVLREFYKERDVIMEERRMGDDNPTRRLYEEFLAAAYKVHPYGHMGIGYMSDIENLTPAVARAFFKKYYCPRNLTVTMVGDVNSDEVKILAKKYFGRIPSGPKPMPVTTVEPPQMGQRRVIIEDSAQPMLLMGYHRPNINHPDNAVIEIIARIFSDGRDSRLYKSLVKEKKIAVSADVYSGGCKYPDLIIFNIMPAKGHTADECEKAVYGEIEKLKTAAVSADELQKAKTLSRADLIRQLESNSDLARQLAAYDVLTGDWRNLFRQLDEIQKVTAADLQRAAREYFLTTNLTVGIIRNNAAGI